MTQQQVSTLRSVFAERLLVVPDYQRPYAWQRKQLEDLWDDLDLIGEGAHYAGTLVLREPLDVTDPTTTSMDEEGVSLRQCEVVDGQQRLTTCVILLDRVRRALNTLAGSGIDGAAEVAATLRRQFCQVKVHGALTPKLQLADDLAEYWADVVLGDATFPFGSLTPGQRRLADAADFFDAKITELKGGADSALFFTRLRELQRRVATSLQFLVYDVNSSAQVGAIFETLNERGRPLTELEKTKNYMLYLTRLIPDARSAQLAGQVNSAWADIFRQLSADSSSVQENQLLRSHWLATENPDAQQWKGVHSVKARFDRARYVSGATRLIPQEAPRSDEGVDPFNQLVGDLEAYVRTLRDSAVYLREILAENGPGSFGALGKDAEEAARATAALRRSGVVAVFLPLLLATRLRYPKVGTIYLQVVRLCEAYSARVFLIGRSRVTAGQPRLYSLAHQMFTGTAAEEVIKNLTKLMWSYAPDKRVLELLGDLSENWYRRPGHKYFLYEYELSLIAPGEELCQFSEFTAAGRERRTTEHVLPQTPRDCWWECFTTDQHAAIVNSLGNLVLTLDNSAYSNKCFVDKRGLPLKFGESPASCYSQGKLHQERMLAAFDRWTPETIADRQRVLADFALSRWHVAAPGEATLEVEDDVISEAESPEDVELLAESIVTTPGLPGRDLDRADHREGR